MQININSKHHDNNKKIEQISVMAKLDEKRK